MANIFLEDETKERLTKALGKMQANKGTVITFSRAVSKLLDLYEKEVK